MNSINIGVIEGWRKIKATVRSTMWRSKSNEANCWYSKDTREASTIPSRDLQWKGTKYLEFLEPVTDLDKAHMKFSTKVISQSDSRNQRQYYAYKNIGSCEASRGDRGNPGHKIARVYKRSLIQSKQVAIRDHCRIALLPDQAKPSARHCKRPYRIPAHILSTTYNIPSKVKQFQPSHLLGHQQAP